MTIKVDSAISNKNLPTIVESTLQNSCIFSLIISNPQIACKIALTLFLRNLGNSRWPIKRSLSFNWLTKKWEKEYISDNKTGSWIYCFIRIMYYCSTTKTSNDIILREVYTYFQKDRNGRYVCIYLGSGTDRKIQKEYVVSTNWLQL
jgi:hypothetical protein